MSSIREKIRHELVLPILMPFWNLPNWDALAIFLLVLLIFLWLLLGITVIRLAQLFVSPNPSNENLLAASVIAALIYLYQLGLLFVNKHTPFQSKKQYINCLALTNTYIYFLGSAFIYILVSYWLASSQYTAVDLSFYLLLLVGAILSGIIMGWVLESQRVIHLAMLLGLASLFHLAILVRYFVLDRPLEDFLFYFSVNLGALVFVLVIVAIIFNLGWKRAKKTTYSSSF